MKLRKSVTKLIDAGNGLIENSGQLSVAHHQAEISFSPQFSQKEKTNERFHTMEF